MFPVWQYFPQHRVAGFTSTWDGRGEEVIVSSLVAFPTAEGGRIHFNLGWKRRRGDCFQSGSISHSRGWLDSLHLCDSAINSIQFDCHRQGFIGQRFVQRGTCLLTPAAVLGHVVISSH